MTRVETPVHVLNSMLSTSECILGTLSSHLMILAEDIMIFFVVAKLRLTPFRSTLLQSVIHLIILDPTDITVHVFQVTSCMRLCITMQSVQDYGLWEEQVKIIKHC